MTDPKQPEALRLAKTLDALHVIGGHANRESEDKFSRARRERKQNAN